MITKVYFPKIRLQELLGRPGGMSREDALEAALENVRSISGEGDQLIEEAIAKIESISAAHQNNSLSKAQLTEVLNQADQIVTLAGTFGYVALDRATRALCDIADGLLRNDMDHAAPILVHAKALRFFAPSGTSRSEAEAIGILSELGKIRAYYRFQALGA